MRIRNQRDLYFRDEDPTFFSTDPNLAGKKIRIRLKKNADPDPTLNQNEEKNIFIFHVVGIIFYIINHHLMLEFV